MLIPEWKRCSRNKIRERLETIAKDIKWASSNNCFFCDTRFMAFRLRFFDILLLLPFRRSENNSLDDDWKALDELIDEISHSLLRLSFWLLSLCSMALCLSVVPFFHSLNNVFFSCFHSVLYIALAVLLHSHFSPSPASQRISCFFFHWLGTWTMACLISRA